LDFIVLDPVDKLLLGYRRNRPAQGYWFVPGGRVGKNETRRDAFARLTLAELGVELDIARSRFAGVYEHIYPDNFAGHPGFGTHYIVLAYEIEAGPDQLRLPQGDQHDSYAWMSSQEILRRDDVHAYSKAYCASLQH
jgi:colanic acid biosynthesis protein WcaH